MIFNEDYISNIKIKHVWTCIFVSISLNYAAKLWLSHVDGVTHGD